MFFNNKKFYFLSGLPRSGNTALSSILNQNKKIKVSANSCLSNILYNISDQKNTKIFKNFPDEKSINDCASEAFWSYYKSWKCDVVIDRSSWGTPDNLRILENYCPNEIKIICPVRDLNEILCSFIIAFSKSQNVNLNDSTQIEKICIDLVENQEMIKNSLWSVDNLLRFKDKMAIFIHYDNFCSRPEVEIERIYKFLNIKKYKHIFNNVEQYSSNGIYYNDEIFGYSLHTIKRKVEKSSYLVEDILPFSIIKRYEHVNFDFLR